MSRTDSGGRRRTGGERYRTRGQRQEGVDILIDYRDQSKAAGQCKSNERCDEALIRDACTEFLKHAQRWRDEGVRTFILFLAADTRRTQLHRERARQRERLRLAGFAFNVWSGAILKSKLRKQRQIVRDPFRYSKTTSAVDKRSLS